MELFKKIILSSIFSAFFMQTFCSQEQVLQQEATHTSMTSLIKKYFGVRVRTFASKIFYNHLNSMIIDYKANYPIRYKIGMQHISGRYVFQDINHLYNGETLLHQAVESKNYKLIQVLLFFGADSGVKNSQGVTPYEISLRYKEPYYAKLLEDYQNLGKKKTDLEASTMGQKYYVKMMHKLIELQRADKQGVQFIIDSLEDYQKRHFYLTNIFLYVIDRKFVNDFINVADTQVTLLQSCIYDKNIDLAQILLYFGADPMLKNSWGVSAFELAVQSKHLQFIKLFWPYVSCDVLKQEMYPVLAFYKDELLACAHIDAQESENNYFLQAVYNYFGVATADERDQTIRKIVNFWN
jgi:hypothetical protein